MAARISEWQTARMDVNELMNLNRPLTNEEAAFLEQEVLKLAHELDGEISKITRDLDPNDPEIARLIAAPRNIKEAIAAATACGEDKRTIWEQKHATKPSDTPFTWEQLPVYARNNEFARVIGRLLVVLPRRLHIYAHNLAGQATLISNCIAMGHRDMPPHESTPKEELRAYRNIGYHATFTIMDMLEDLSKESKLGRSEVTEAMSLIGKIRDQFETSLRELDTVSQNPALMH
jgi:hypothetical protein